MRAAWISVPATGGSYGTLSAYLNILVGAVSGKLTLALILMVATSLTEWVGLLLLVPLLGLAGVELGMGAAGGIAESASSLIRKAGVHPTLLAVLGLYVVIVSARAVLHRWQSLVIVDFSSAFILYLRRRLYHALANAGWLFFARHRSSDFQHAIMGQVAVAGHASEILLSLAASTLIGAVYLLLALKLSPILTLLACGCGIGLVILLRKGTERARDVGERMSERSASLLGAITEHLGGMKTAKSYGAEDRNEAVFTAINEDVLQVRMEGQRNHSSVRAWFEVGSVLVLSVLLYVSLEELALATAEILLLLFVFTRLVPRFSGIQQSYQSFVNALPAFADVMGQIERCEAAAEPRLEGSRRRLELREAIQFDHVEFRYGENREGAAITDVNLVIPAHETTAIIGASGAGKSTIADLVMGLLVPRQGRILIDGAPLLPESVRAWREGIGYVPQDTFLFHDSVRTNLLWARPGASEADVREALRLAAADAFVSRLPNGLDTVIGDRGVLLSGGERQRLALARALLRKPSLLILDEATSALDSENERRIQRAIDQLHGELTILIITHRLAAIRDADQIHVVEDGRLVESGDWESLVARGGRFMALAAAQGMAGDQIVPVHETGVEPVALHR